MFSANIPTVEIYRTLAQPIVAKALEGYNGTIFTYGLTCSGKTYTMVGNNVSPGIIPLAVTDIFNTIKSSDDRKYLVRIGYIEIYNDRIFDLFDNRRPGLGIFDVQDNTIVDQKEFIVNSKEEVFEFFKVGNSRKKMAETINNENSSRSHTIFRLSIESDSVENSDDPKISQLYLVDLAGSEKPDVSKPSFNEGLHINKSLLALGKIIRKLAEKNSRIKHINVRENKLTRVLSPALKGNCLTAVICTVSPTEDETLQTISFLKNLQKIKTYSVLNIANRARMLLKNFKLNTSSTSSLNRKRLIVKKSIGKTSSSNENGRLKAQIIRLENEKLETQEKFLSAQTQLEEKDKIIEDLNENLTQSVEYIEISELEHERISFEKDEIIKSLEKKVEENQKLYESHLDAFKTLEKSHEEKLHNAAQKILTQRKCIKLYKKDVCEKTLALSSFESRVHTLASEAAEIKLNYVQRLQESRRYLTSVQKEKDAKIKFLQEKILQMETLETKKEIEDLEMYIKLEKYFGALLEEAHKNFEDLRKVVEAKEMLLNLKNGEIESVHYELNSIEQQGLDHANDLKRHFEMLEHGLKLEISNLKALICEKDEIEKRLNETMWKEVVMAINMKEKFESKIIDIEKHFTELLSYKEEEMWKLKQENYENLVVESQTLQNEQSHSSSISSSESLIKKSPQT